MSMSLSMNNSKKNGDAGWTGWAFQSAVVGLTCGIGCYSMIMATKTTEEVPPREKKENNLVVIRHCSDQVTNLVHQLQQQIYSSKWLWLLAAGTCPHSWGRFLWYPLVLFYVQEESSNSNDDDDDDNHGDKTEKEGAVPASNETPNDAKFGGQQSLFQFHPSSDTMQTPLRSNILPQRSLIPEVPSLLDETTVTAAAAEETNIPSPDESTSSSVKGGGTTSSSTTTNHRYVEMLVHNVSHTDLVLSVDTTANNHGGMLLMGDNSPFCLCRPRFSAFDLYTRRILNNLGGPQQQTSTTSTTTVPPPSPPIASFPRYERSDDTRYTIVTPRPSRQAMLPTGFCLSQQQTLPSQMHEELSVPSEELINLRFRGRDAPRIEPYCINNANGQPQEAAMDDNMDDNDGGHNIANNKRPPEEPLRFNYVFFPLLATLLPRWHQRIAAKYNSDSQDHDTNATDTATASSSKTKIKKVLILVTGVGTPRNWTHSITGNSTQACAKLMERFIAELYPDVTVRFVHSETNIFRYDENIEFAKHELMPCIDAYRDAHARGEPYPDEIISEHQLQQNSSNNEQRQQHAAGTTFNTEWKQSFSVTLSFADGSPARTHAIQASLRSYRPIYFHFWQLKTFWHDTKICEDDIEVHSFEEMETVPAMEVSQTSDAHIQMVVKEMKTFRETFLATVNSHDNDIRKFWLRKTKKPVLAVLLVEHPDEQGHVMYRGTNMEVSMPTGSLCAERNVIGTALASNPGLKREDLRMVAVLAVPLPQQHEQEKVMSTMMCQEVLQPPPESVRRSTSMASFASVVEEGEDDDQDHHGLDDSWVVESSSSAAHLATTGKGREGADATEAAAVAAAGKAAAATSATPSEIVTVQHTAPDFSPALNSAIPPAFKLPPAMSLAATTPKPTPPGTPRRRISLYTTSANNSANNSVNGGGGESSSKNNNNNNNPKKKKKTIVVHSNEDLNPLRPCGACNEWLKKIAESNPYFKVLTFTDADCNGVYVSPCQE